MAAGVLASSSPSARRTEGLKVDRTLLIDTSEVM